MSTCWGVRRLGRGEGFSVRESDRQGIGCPASPCCAAFVPCSILIGLGGCARWQPRRWPCSAISTRGTISGLPCASSCRKNPNYRSAAPLRLYFLRRVLNAEQEPSVRERLQRIAELRPKRSATAKEAAARSRQKNQARVGAGSRSRRRPEPPRAARTQAIKSNQYGAARPR